MLDPWRGEIVQRRVLVRSAYTQPYGDKMIASTVLVVEAIRNLTKED